MNLRTLTTAAAVLLALTGCSSPAAPAYTVTPRPTALAVAAADRETAWAECQQLALRKLKTTDTDVREFTAQSEHGTASRMTARGRLRWNALDFAYSCAFSFTTAGTIASEALTISPA